MGQEKQPGRRSNLLTTRLLRISVSLIAPVIAYLALRWSFIFMRDSEANRLLVGAVALIVGVGGVWFLFWMTNDLVGRLPDRIRDRVQPYVFVGPAVVILVVYLVYPVFNSFYLSFLDAASENFVGLDNWIYSFTNPDSLVAVRNNVLWMIFVTGFAVSLGLVIAAMVDRIGIWEAPAKSLIFLPMAISAVGASIIWRFMYHPSPISKPQIGLVNAIIVALGGEPVPFLITRPLNNFALMVVMIWTLTGFCMVVLSAAVKGVPTELLEAARIDGASEVRIFFGVIIPYIRGTLITITTTVVIMVLKVFDIVFVMASGGQFDTDVIANRMYKEFFTFGHFGRGSVMALVLLIAVVPVIISNIRNLRAGRS